VSSVREGRKVGGFSAPSKCRRGVGHVLRCNLEIRHSKTTSLACLKHTHTHPNPSVAGPTAARNAEGDFPISLKKYRQRGLWGCCVKGVLTTRTFGSDE
jgi:hypothetical protein